MSCIILLFLTPMCALRWHGKQTSQPKNSEKAHNAPERKANTVEVGVGRNGARVTNYCFTLHTFNCSEPSFGHFAFFPCARFPRKWRADCFSFFERKAFKAKSQLWATLVNRSKWTVRLLIFCSFSTKLYFNSCHLTRKENNKTFSMQNDNDTYKIRRPAWRWLWWKWWLRW